jgi:hypothetical protein
MGDCLITSGCDGDQYPVIDECHIPALAAGDFQSPQQTGCSCAQFSPYVNLIMTAD